MRLADGKEGADADGPRARSSKEQQGAARSSKGQQRGAGVSEVLSKRRSSACDSTLGRLMGPKGGVPWEDLIGLLTRLLRCEKGYPLLTLTKPP